MSLWFTSDVHLADDRPQLVALFFKWLEQAQEQGASALYLLGDIFEVWLGLDCTPAFWPALIRLSQTLKQRGLPIYFLPGNRDFLFDHAAAETLGWHLLPEIYALEAYNQRILLMHGDLLCTLDKPYQLYRVFSHSKLIRWLFEAAPRALRQRIATRLRRGFNPSTKPLAALSWQAKTMIHRHVAIQYLQHYEATTLIHGHVHHLGIHLYQAPEGNYQHFILSDWQNFEGNDLRLSSKGLARHRF